MHTCLYMYIHMYMPNVYAQYVHTTFLYLLS